MKIVLVDDSKAIQESFTDLLASLPHIEFVGCAEDVNGALALIDATRPDLVVLDLDLRHGQRGIDVLKHVSSSHPHMKVVVLSNAAGLLNRKKLLAAGALAFFDKSTDFLLARDWIGALAANP